MPILAIYLNNTDYIRALQIKDRTKVFQELIIGYLNDLEKEVTKNEHNTNL